MDIVSFSAMLNVIWYVVTMMVLLYKFTTIFSRLNTVYKGVVKVKDGIFWLKDKLFKKDNLGGYQPINTDELNYYVPESEEVNTDRCEIPIPTESLKYSEFISQKKSEKERQQQSDAKMSESNVLLELGMFLPFYNRKEKIDEEIPLMESRYVDADEVKE